MNQSLTKSEILKMMLLLDKLIVTNHNIDKFANVNKR